MKIGLIYKICDSAGDILNQADFSPSATPTEKEIGQQIVTCKLVHTIEPESDRKLFFFFVLAKQRNTLECNLGFPHLRVLA